MMPLQGFKPVLGALLLGQLRTPGAAMTRLPPRRSTGGSPGATPVPARGKPCFPQQRGRERPGGLRAAPCLGGRAAASHARTLFSKRSCWEQTRRE